MFHLHETPVSVSGFIWLGVNTLCVGFPKPAKINVFWLQDTLIHGAFRQEGFYEDF